MPMGGNRFNYIQLPVHYIDVESANDKIAVIVLEKNSFPLWNYKKPSAEETSQQSIDGCRLGAFMIKKLLGR